jgi:1,2-phenylacetyl-CoA epoxidase PaaB subunit
MISGYLYRFSKELKTKNVTQNISHHKNCRIQFVNRIQGHYLWSVKSTKIWIERPEERRSAEVTQFFVSLGYRLWL